MKRFEFKIKLFGVDKVFRINGTDYNDARKNLDVMILKNMEMTNFKEVKENPITEAAEATMKMFDECFKNVGNLFGNKK